MLVLLFSCSIQSRAYTNQEKLRVLRSLIERDVVFDSKVSIDSFISWSEQLIPTLQEKGKEENYFLIQAQLVQVYLTSGDISLAIDRARIMYEEAQRLHYKFGNVLAKQALGDTYMSSNMEDKAMECYQNALQDLQQTKGHQSYRNRLLLKIVSALRQSENPEKAQPILEELQNMIKKNPDSPLVYGVLTQETYFNILRGQSDRKYLEKAQIGLEQMDSICRKTQESFQQFAYEYTQAAYYRALGTWDKTAFAQSIELYQKMLNDMAGHKGSSYYRRLASEIIKLYKTQGLTEEACKVYQNLYPTVDSIASQGYNRQINTLKTKYTVDQMEIENKEAQNKFLLSVLIGSLLLLLLFFVIVTWLRHQQKALRLSVQKLEQSRIHAENATHAKSVFLSNMSHEIRTPLNALSGFSTLLTEEGLDNETRQQCTEVIQQNSDLLLKLIDDVIDLSSLEYGKLQFSLKRYDAVSICRNVVDTVTKVKQTQADVLFETDLKSQEIDTDDSRLQQVIINLLINATKFTPRGSITLKLEKLPDQDMLQFSVTDTGCGIPLEKQGNIFRRFEKLNENVQGSGLGLSICQLIIEYVGGKIWIDPSYTEGCRFIFTHPINQNNRKEERS
ncbi:MAG: HAMP domain-containing sensor histidine kinase [Bacteroides sp.]|nr:HAMP domain-containing sensor histidine kinase [Bacteroides sp.]